jgi:hypothetical protein
MDIGPPPGPERRAIPRLRTLQRGRVCYGMDHALSFDCMIRNLTAKGAMLRCPASQEIPDRFTLLHINGGMAFEAELTWRRGEDAGVKFGLAHDLRGPVSDAYRTLRHVWVALAPV